jgi:hypothetical protein
MMIGSPAARWLLTAAFAVATLAALQPARRWADPPAAVFCVAMCAALIAMTWVAESAAAGWAQAAGFGVAGLWFALAGRTLPDRVYHVLMAAAMIWMLTVMSGVATTGSSMSGAEMSGAEMSGAAMSGAAMSGPVRAVSGLVAACCIAAALPWLARAVGPRFRIADPGAAGNAVMSAGMAAMVLAML